jgi:hypothetical protein
MIIIAERNKAKRLQDPVGCLSRRRQHFRHADHSANLGLKTDLNEVALAECLSQFEQPAGHGDGIEFASGALAIVESDCSQNRTAELHPGRTLCGVWLGEVGHSQKGL